MVFKRYSNPFLFLDNLIENGLFSKGIDSIYKQYNDDRFWELYLHTNPDKSFTDWKKEVTGNTEIDKEVKLSKEEFEAAKVKSRNILKNFNPNK